MFICNATAINDLINNIIRIIDVEKQINLANKRKKYK